MRLTQNELVEALPLMHSMQSDSVARLVLQKKAENFFRDHMNMHLESICWKFGDDCITSIREYKKHDVAIVTGIPNRNGVLTYAPSTLIEIKFTNIYWILANKDHPVGIREEIRDNIWRENYRKNPQKAIDDTESGIKRDLKKLIRSQNDHPNHDIAIHHVLALTNPHRQINNRYKNTINALNHINACLDEYGDYQEIARLAHDVLKSQLSEVQANFIQDRSFSICPVEPLTLGKAFGTNVDLQMFVISESVNSSGSQKH